MAHWEYGVQHNRKLVVGGGAEFEAELLVDPVPHREGMTEEQARMWIKEWVDMGGKVDTFSLIRRPVGNWEVVE